MTESYKRDIITTMSFDADLTRSEQLLGVRNDEVMMRIATFFLLTVVCALSSPSIVTAQSSSQLQPGTHLRLWTYGGRVTEGLLVSVDREVLVLGSRDFDETVQIDSIVSLYVRQRKSYVLAGAGIGLMSGALLGALIGSTQEFCIFDCSPATALGIVIGAPAGLFLGAVIGASIRPDPWEAVSIDRLQLTPVVSPREIGLGASVRF